MFGRSGKQDGGETQPSGSIRPDIEADLQSVTARVYRYGV